MRGVFQHNIDTKGRLSLPAKFRETLGDCFIISQGIPDQTKKEGECLWCMSEEAWNSHQALIAQQPMEEAQQMEYFFSNSYDVEPDAQGRIVVPPQLRAWADLKKEVAVIGFSNRVEIWDAQLWSASSNVPSRQIGKLMAGIRRQS